MTTPNHPPTPVVLSFLGIFCIPSLSIYFASSLTLHCLTRRWSRIMILTKTASWTWPSTVNTNLNLKVRKEAHYQHHQLQRKRMKSQVVPLLMKLYSWNWVVESDFTASIVCNNALRHIRIKSNRINKCWPVSGFLDTEVFESNPGLSSLHQVLCWLFLEQIVLFVWEEIFVPPDNYPSRSWGLPRN